MAATIKYATAQTLVWGASGAGTSALGVILSCSVKHTSEVAEIKNASGENHGVVFYDPKTEISAEILCTSNAAAPAPGTEVTIGDVTAALVIDSEVIWSNTDAKKIRLTLKKWTAA